MKPVTNSGGQKPDFNRYLIEEYAASIKNETGNKFFSVMAALCLGVAFTGAVYLSGIEISEDAAVFQKLRKLDVQFVMNKKEIPVEKKKPKPKKVVKKKEIKKASLKEEIKAAEKITTKPRPRRKVYGVRRVYSRGLGSGYGGSDAVVAKLGNTLETPVDTIQAMENDLRGELVSVTKVSTMPKIKRSAKPEYTKAMKDAGVIGKVKAKVLVDIDGTAKKIIIIKHLGFGTRDSSVAAIRKMRFVPGTINNAPVAVWIPLTFRFELQT
jgi:hypothetical protein